MESLSDLLKILAGLGSFLGLYLSFRKEDCHLISIVWNVVAILLWIVIIIN